MKHPYPHCSVETMLQKLPSISANPIQSHLQQHLRPPRDEVQYRVLVVLVWIFGLNGRSMPQHADSTLLAHPHLVPSKIKHGHDPL